ncbi:MAG: FHA domain-containing protein [Candidatus Woesearchaeota archaeon]|jgi:pSer/pThr/pTyr-binding forkhead associated (FHA) protein
MGIQLVLKGGLWFSDNSETITNLPHIRSHISFTSSKIISLLKFPILIGRDGKNHIIIGDITTSRKHAKITKKGWFNHRYFLIDVGSKTGTKVVRDDVLTSILKKDPFELRNKDMIQIGMCVLEVLI